MTRRFLVAAVAVSGLVMLSAAATAQRAQPVEGGGSFNDAPIVAEGTFADTLRPRERLFYAIELAQGQRLNMRAIIHGVPQLEDDWLSVELRVHDPSRDEIAGELSSNQVRGTGRTKLAISGEKVGDDIGYAEPGLYYVAVAADQGPRRIQLDMELKFTVKGRAEAAPTPTPTPEASPTPAESPSPYESPDEPVPGDSGTAAPTGDGDDLPVGLFVGFFLAGALGGGMIELFRGQRARA